MPNLEVCKGGSSDGRSSLSESGLRVSALTRLSIRSLNNKIFHIYLEGCNSRRGSGSSTALNQDGLVKRLADMHGEAVRAPHPM